MLMMLMLMILLMMMLMMVCDVPLQSYSMLVKVTLQCDCCVMPVCVDCCGYQCCLAQLLLRSCGPCCKVLRAILLWCCDSSASPAPAVRPCCSYSLCTRKRGVLTCCQKFLLVATAAAAATKLLTVTVAAAAPLLGGLPEQLKQLTRQDTEISWNVSSTKGYSLAGTPL